MTADDQLVANYLRRLDVAARVLPADRRAELIEEITAHIAEARSAAVDGQPSTRDILERLGEPAAIVRAAGEPAFGQLPTGEPRAAGSSVSGPGATGLEIITVVLLLVGGIVVPVIGWVVGAVLLWASPRWSRGDKLLGTFVWPGGLLAPFSLAITGIGAAVFTASGTACSPLQEVGPHARHAAFLLSAQYLPSSANCPAPPGGLAWPVILIVAILLAASIAGPIFAAVRLLRRAGQTADTGPDPAALQPV